ncbi:MAG: hypothetical protein K6F69_01825 [Treponema sp.]|nr:hypothetical protein [Treponema sp.]
MYRAEIIANQSIEDDLIETLEQTIPDILYTIVPLVHGRGKDSRKLGTSTWPETNFLIFTYVEDKDIEKIKAVVKAVKKKFKSEGIKLFILKSAE